MKEQAISFNAALEQDVTAFLNAQRASIPEEDTLKVDLHCHDLNSNVPDELWGRMLRLPETWTPTDDVVASLQANNCEALAITNHNNATSCWQLLDRGIDVLVGAEFTCTFPEYGINVHVLTYGFTPTQEAALLRHRKNIYAFLRYAAEQELPTVLPHPLFFYKAKKQPTPPELFEKFALLFERFEVLNGQRSPWQNLLTKTWIEQIDDEKMSQWQRKHGINPHDFTWNPYKKRMTGGSDDHFGVFAGSCGTYFHVPNKHELLQRLRPSELALAAIRQGHSIPYGSMSPAKLSLAFLDYFAQMVLYSEDPGLLRIALHRGSTKDKLFCLGISNVIQELRRHRHTMRFFSVFHEALRGKKPGFLLSLGTRRDFKPVLRQLEHLAVAKSGEGDAFLRAAETALPMIFEEISRVAFTRVESRAGRQEIRARKATKRTKPANSAEHSLLSLIQRVELPSQLRQLFSPEKKARRSQGISKISGRNEIGMSNINLATFLDDLTFPALAGSVLMGTSFISTQVLHANRPFLTDFAKNLGKYVPPTRVLWLSDTFGDRNGVSTVLEQSLSEIRRRNLPIDILTCSSSLVSGPNLIVTRPIKEFLLPELDSQPLRVPNIMEIQDIALRGGYDRVLCSTELCMGPVALYLKQAFSIPAYFYLHTDWLDYLRRRVRLDKSNMDRVRRLLRAFYQGFDGIFTLNSDHRAWLASSAMNIPHNRLFGTAHWAASHFCIEKGSDYPRNAETLRQAKGAQREVLYVGRLSDEKGVLELPIIYEELRRRIPSMCMTIIGTGPAERQLREQMPDARFVGWLSSEELVAYYNRASVLVLPSRFDAFGCVVLEAMSCGLPVAAYNTKGPKDIIQHNSSGILVDTLPQLIDGLTGLLLDQESRDSMAKQAELRSLAYDPESIMDDLLAQMGVGQAGRSKSVGAREEFALPAQRSGFATASHSPA